MTIIEKVNADAEYLKANYAVVRSSRSVIEMEWDGPMECRLNKKRMCK